MSNSTTPLDQIASNQAAKEVVMNALMDAASPATLWGRHASACSGLVWAWYGGSFVDSTATLHAIANGSVTLTASTTNYLYADPTTGAVSANTTGFPAGKVPLYVIATGTTTVSSYTDWRSYQPSAVASSGTPPALSTLPDVNVTEGAGIDGYFLKWNNATGKWIASASGGGGASALTGLSDVNVTEGAGIDGYSLVWNNATSKWIATNVSGGGGGGSLGPTPTIVQKAIGSNSSTGTTVTLASAPTPGNVLVAIFGGYSGSSNPYDSPIVASPEGFGVLACAPSNANEVSYAVARKVVSGDGTSYTFTVNSGGMVALYEISGAGYIKAVPMTNVLASSGGTSKMPDASALSGNVLAIAAIHNDAGAAYASSITSGWTLDYGSSAGPLSFHSLITAHQSFSSGGQIVGPSIVWNGANAAQNSTSITILIHPASVGGGGGTTSWVEKTANYTAAAGDAIAANTSAGAFTVTLPASPSAGQMVQIVDEYQTFDINALTVNPNGGKIGGLTQNAVLSLAGQFVQLTYENSTVGWILDGGRAPLIGSVWNLYDSQMGQFLFDAGRAFGSTGTNWASARTIAGGARSSGKLYFEMKVIAQATFSPLIGVGTSATPLTNYCGNDSTGWGMTCGPSGAALYHGGSGSGQSTYAVGDVCGVAVDFTASTGSIQFYKNNVANGNATGLTLGTMYPMVSAGAPGAIGHLRTRAAQCTYSPPSGFSYWDN